MPRKRQTVTVTVFRGNQPATRSEGVNSPTKRFFLHAPPVLAPPYEWHLTHAAWNLQRRIEHGNTTAAATPTIANQLRNKHRVPIWCQPEPHETFPRGWNTAKIFDHLLALFPFETAYFIPHGLKTSFVGHPALEEKEGAADKFKKSFSIPEDCLILSLLPGSRTSEVDRLLPIFEETIFKLKQHYPKLFILMPTVPALEGYIRNIVSEWPVENVILVKSKDKQNAFAASDFAIAASGTVTLELALARVPTIVTYKLNAFTGWIAYFLVNHKSIVLANRILERPLFPLLVQASCNSDKIVEVLLSQKNKKNISEEMELASSTIRERLSIGRSTSSDLAAQVILDETRVL